MSSVFFDWEIGRREGELPEGWAKATLEEIVVHKLSGEWGEEPWQAAKDPELVRVRVIRGTEFRSWDRDKGSTAAERAVKRSKLTGRLLAVGDLVVEVSGGGASQPVGRTLLIDAEALQRADAPLICANFCRQVRVHPEVNPAFVHLVLLYLYLCGGLDEYQTQTTNLRNLNFKSFLSGVVLPIPPQAEQARIVEAVRELMVPLRWADEGLARMPDSLRRFRQSVLAAACSGRLTEDWREEQHEPSEALADRLARAFAARREAYEMACCEAEAFDRRAPRRPKSLASTEWEAPAPLDVPEVPEGWSLAALQDVVHRTQYGLSVKAEEDAKTGIPILRMANIQDGRMDGTDLKYVGREGIDVQAFTVRRGDILFNRTNSAELVGKSAVFDLDLEAVFASYLVRIECDEGLVSSRYLCAWLNSPWGRRWARTVRTDCSNQSNIKVSLLQKMPVPVPPLAEQHEIVRLVEKHLAFAEAVGKRVAAAEGGIEGMRRTILARALRGELVPTEAELARSEETGYEPALDLLERIGATVTTISERILAAIRQACWGAGEMTREELIRRVAGRLHLRLSKSARARLERHVDVAIERRIVACKGDLLVGATPTFGRYDFKFLIETARKLFPRGVEHEKEEVVRAVAAWLGYGQVTPAIRERMDRVFQWAAQERLVEIRGERIVFL
ncbi:MAG TPA: restriction endonuclease subunit S [Thermoanaerobaculia bacterium]